MNRDPDNELPASQMSMRDIFANASLMQFCSAGNIKEFMRKSGESSLDEIYPRIALSAYKMADAMLKQRPKKIVL